MGFENSIVKSWAGLTVDVATTHTEQILPRPAIASCSLVALLAKWAAASPRNGGLRCPDAMEKAAMLLRALVAGCSRREFEMKVRFDMSWRFRWPRPPTPCEHEIKLKVDKDMCVDVSAWADLMEAPRSFGAPLPLAALRWNLIGEDGRVRLAGLLTAKTLVDNVLCAGFLGQLCHEIGSRVEWTFFHSMRMDSSDWPLRVHDTDNNGEWSVRHIDNLCMKYVWYAKQAAMQFKHFGMAVDKYNAFGMELCNACFVLPNNVAFVGVPQVAVV